jgi:hypothetical protein
VTRRYPVRAKTSTLVLASLFFVGCAVVCFYAAGNPAPMGGRVFDDISSPTLFIVMGILSSLMAAAGVVALIYYRGHQEVVVDETSITVPGPVWNRKPRTVKLADIVELKLQTISSQTFVSFVTPAGKVSLAKSHLADGGFEEIVSYVRAKIGAR